MVFNAYAFKFIFHFIQDSKETKLKYIHIYTN